MNALEPARFGQAMKPPLRTESPRSPVAPACRRRARRWRRRDWSGRT